MKSYSIDTFNSVFYGEALSIDNIKYIVLLDSTNFNEQDIVFKENIKNYPYYIVSEDEKDNLGRFVFNKKDKNGKRQIVNFDKILIYDKNEDIISYMNCSYYYTLDETELHLQVNISQNITASYEINAWILDYSTHTESQLFSTHSKVINYTDTLYNSIANYKKSINSKLTISRLNGFNIPESFDIDKIYQGSLFNLIYFDLQKDKNGKPIADNHYLLDRAKRMFSSIKPYSSTDIFHSVSKFSISINEFNDSLEYSNYFFTNDSQGIIFPIDNKGFVLYKYDYKALFWSIELVEYKRLSLENLNVKVDYFEINNNSYISFGNSLTLSISNKVPMDVSLENTTYINAINKLINFEIGVAPKLNNISIPYFSDEYYEIPIYYYDKVNIETKLFNQISSFTNVYFDYIKSNGLPIDYYSNKTYVNYVKDTIMSIIKYCDGSSSKKVKVTELTKLILNDNLANSFISNNLINYSYPEIDNIVYVNKPNADLKISSECIKLINDIITEKRGGNDLGNITDRDILNKYVADNSSSEDPILGELKQYLDASNNKESLSKLIFNKAYSIIFMDYWSSISDSNDIYYSEIIQDIIEKNSDTEYGRLLTSYITNLNEKPHHDPNNYGYEETALKNSLKDTNFDKEFKVNNNSPNNVFPESQMSITSLTRLIPNEELSDYKIDENKSIDDFITNTRDIDFININSDKNWFIDQVKTLDQEKIYDIYFISDQRVSYFEESFRGIDDYTKYLYEKHKKLIDKEIYSYDLYINNDSLSIKNAGAYFDIAFNKPNNKYAFLNGLTKYLPDEGTLRNIIAEDPTFIDDKITLDNMYICEAMDSQNNIVIGNNESSFHEIYTVDDIKETISGNIRPQLENDKSTIPQVYRDSDSIRLDISNTDTAYVTDNTDNEKKFVLIMRKEDNDRFPAIELNTNTHNENDQYEFFKTLSIPVSITSKDELEETGEYYSLSFYNTYIMHYLGLDYSYYLQDNLIILENGNYYYVSASDSNRYFIMKIPNNSIATQAAYIKLMLGYTNEILWKFRESNNYQFKICDEGILVVDKSLADINLIYYFKAYLINNSGTRQTVFKYPIPKDITNFTVDISGGNLYLYYVYNGTKKQKVINMDTSIENTLSRTERYIDKFNAGKMYIEDLQLTEY